MPDLSSDFSDADDTIVYPEGLKEISEHLSSIELNKRLKLLARRLMDLEQNSSGERKWLAPLARLLATAPFLRHAESAVRRLTACCLASMLRILAPHHPYSSYSPSSAHAHIKEIFMFFTEQLQGLADPTGYEYRQCYYLLESVTLVESYVLCLQLEDSNEVFTHLFRTLFSVVRRESVENVHRHSVTLMSTIIMEAKGASTAVLDSILYNLIRSEDFDERSYSLAKDLLKKTTEVIEPSITNLFNQVVILGREEVSDLSTHMGELLLELYAIDASLLLSTLPQLEGKLTSEDASVRLATVSLLAKMFGAAGSELALKNSRLWRCFVRRFKDVSAPVRLRCVKFAARCLKNNPGLAKDLCDALEGRSRDPEEAVHFQLVCCVSSALKLEPSLLHWDALPRILRSATADKRVSVRNEAIRGLASLYYHQCQREDTDAVSWIPSVLLHFYYRNRLEDRLLVERMFTQYLVPYCLEAEERMNQLLHLYSSLPPSACKAVNEMWKSQSSLRAQLRALLKLIIKSRTSTLDKEILEAETAIAVCLPDHGTPEKSLRGFTKLLRSDTEMRKLVAVIVDPECCCKTAAHCLREAQQRLEMVRAVTKPMVGSVMKLLGRMAPLIIDAEAVEVLVRSVEPLSAAMEEEEGLLLAPILQDARPAFELLRVLSFVHTDAFLSPRVLEPVLLCVRVKYAEICSSALHILRNTAPGMLAQRVETPKELVPMLLFVCRHGAPGLVKHALHCLHGAIPDWQRHFAHVFQHASSKLVADTAPEKLLGPLACVSVVVLLAPEEFSNSVTPLVDDFIVAELLMGSRFPEIRTPALWIDKEEVSPETTAKMQGMKLLVRWLLGVRDSSLVPSTLNLLCRILVAEGDLSGHGSISEASKSHLRLAAAVAMLKLAQEPSYRDVFSHRHFQLCVLVINDQCFQVRERFAVKLHKLLTRLWLPLKFVSAFALCARDPMPERRLHAHHCLLHNVAVRRQLWHQRVSATSSTTLTDVDRTLLPENMLPFTVHLLAHDPDFRDPDSVNQLLDIHESVHLVLDVLLDSDENHSHAYMWRMLALIKQTHDLHHPNSVKLNQKLYSICDIVLEYIEARSTTYKLEPTFKPLLPAGLFTAPDKSFSNTKRYLPEGFKPPQFSTKAVRSLAAQSPNIMGKRILTISAAHSLKADLLSVQEDETPDDGNQKEYSGRTSSSKKSTESGETLKRKRQSKTPEPSGATGKAVEKSERQVGAKRRARTNGTTKAEEQEEATQRRQTQRRKQRTARGKGKRP
ncbi:unnamed protein product [Lampetra planeri]